MRKTHETKDKSSVYRTNGLGKITAPTGVSANEPKGVKIVGTGDLRGGKK